MRGLIFLIFGFLSFSAAIMMGAAGLSAEAADSAYSKNVEILNPYAFATSERQRHGAIFFTVRYTGDAADSNDENGAGADAGGRDRIIEARADVSEIVELHTHIQEDDGVMRMRKVEALEISESGELVLKPRGDHIMLIGLTRQLIEGETIPLTLEFERAGAVSVDVPIIQAGTQPQPQEKQQTKTLSEEPSEPEGVNPEEISEDHQHHDHH
ncbi:MAG: copper chaperone PCu(A)C [Alphaproteobacteria bacterium]